MRKHILSILILLITVLIHSRDGDLDESFNRDGDPSGTLMTVLGSYSGANSVVLDETGRVLIGGVATIDSNDFFFIACYRTDGQLDTGFNSSGAVSGTPGIAATLIDGGSVGFTAAMARQPDGRFIIVGTSSDRFALARFDGSGRLDESFNSTGAGGVAAGTVVTSFTSAVEASGVAVQTDGKIIVVGTMDGVYAVLARYNVDGSLDESFGENGKRAITDAPEDEEVAGVVLQADGKIVVVGKADSQKVLLRRFLRDGAVDQAFGDAGRVTFQYDPGNSADRGNAALIQPDGNIVVIGQTESSFLVMRLLPTGFLDESFGIRKIDPAAGSNSQGYGVTWQPDGKIVLVGDEEDAFFDYTFTTIRLHMDGAIDTGFGEEGIVRTSIDGNSVGRAIILQENGKILVAGLGGDQLNVAAARYESQPIVESNLAKLFRKRYSKSVTQF